MNEDSTAENQRLAVEVSLTARGKTGRYYSEPSIRHIVANCGGVLFWDPRQNLHILRTHRGNGSNRICLLLAIEDDGVTVVNQTSDHYDWGEMEHVLPPIGPVGADS